MGIEDKLYLIRFNVDEEQAHIRLKRELCQDCPERACLYACPVENYRWEREELIFSWQGCLECGSCRIACSRGAIDWNYPRGGFGVCFRYG
ncbi:MAG: 4Fe-4S dicluster domain-containing protein [Candidatus Tectomicrobia bacterium]|uniref:4Fe-4S dicluster domain-containing protein n=1 Tax=Tectimicrobiota bacterium TaxID=2528274 RepID=A0A932CPH1_UNCTE|nr:4Fe-4S dicluster domain-containing protein [Candidatus Tectomicrobia bacterium]